MWRSGKIMNARHALMAFTGIVALCGSATVQAAAAKPAAKPAAKAPTPAPAPVIAPEIKTALDRMGNALRALRVYEVKADVTIEDVLVTGQKLQSSMALTIDVKYPDRLYMDANAAHKHRMIYYDGKQITVYGPKTGYYASVAAPPTTRETITVLHDKYGFETPLADLFTWGTPTFPVERIKSAMSAGTDIINGKTCEHYAFRQEGADWQLWIDKEGPGLPCKLLITDTEDPAHPQTTSVMTWNTSIALEDSR
ncbi:MAG: DUF2092 domain-containing protein, partial [Alphaproteobacteria bacterium]